MGYADGDRAAALVTVVIRCCEGNGVHTPVPITLTFAAPALFWQGIVTHDRVADVLE